MVDNLIDSIFKAVEVCQGGIGRWESVPLNICKRIEGILIVICPGVQQPECQRVGIPR